MNDADKQVAEALVSELGFGDDSGDVDPGTDVDLGQFFKEAAPEQPETVAEEAPAKFVHEPTGKEFDSEVEFLRYDAGWKNDQWGRKFKELEERIGQKAETPKAEAEVKQLTKRDLIEKLWPNQPQEYKDNPVAEFMLEGIDNALAIYGGQQQQVIKALQETVSRLEGQLQETSLRSQFGIDPTIEQKLTEKHSWLKGISDPAARMAAMKDLVGKQGAPETVSPKLADKIPQRKAADHVEGSAVSSPPDQDADFTSKFDKADEGQQLGILKSLIRKTGEFGGWTPYD